MLPIHAILLYSLFVKYSEGDGFSIYSTFVIALLILISLTICYQIKYLLTNIHSLIDINKNNGLITYNNLFHKIIKKEKVIDKNTIISIEIAGDSVRPNYKGGRLAIDIFDPLGCFDNRVFIDTTNGKQLVFSSIFDKETDYYAWRLSNYIGCGVFTNNFTD